MQNRDLAGWVAAFSKALESGDPKACTSLFSPSAMWRDILALTWNLVTVEGAEAIADMLVLRLPTVGFSALQTDAAGAATEGWISFETKLGNGAGYVRLSEGLCLTILTELGSLRGHEEAIGLNRLTGNEPDLAGRNWLDRLNDDAAILGRETQPYVLIIGGGQGGLALGARLKALNIPCLIIDKHPRIGDQWRSRYDSLTLHDPVWYDHLPYLPFPENWPVYTPKDKMGDWLEAYAGIMELNVWTSTECTAAAFDEEAQHWRITVCKNGEISVLTAAHLVMAVGNAGFPNVPAFPGADSFNGALYHSSAHKGGAEDAGKRVVVIGSNNSAHDICAELITNGADVTMVQRSSTLVVQQKTTQDVLLQPLYSQAAVDQGMTTERADLMVASIPIRMQEQMYKPVWDHIQALDADFYAELEKAGFHLDFAEDGTGLGMKYLRTASGYYVDVGASAMIADGRIKLRSGVGVDRIVEDGLILTDGSQVPADIIVMATGFGSMEQWVARLISPEVAEKVGSCWGYGSGHVGDPGPWEGELRNMWKPTRQNGLWFHGGNLAQSRFYSRYLALQIKARYEGLPVSVYSG